MNSIQIFKYKEKPKEFYLSKSDCLFYDPAWITVLENTYGFKFFSAVNEKTNNYLVFAFLENPFEKKIISLPFSDYVQLENNTVKEDEQFIQAIEKQFPGIPILYKSTHSLSSEFSSTHLLKKAYFHRIPTSNREKLATLQKPTFQNKVRQAKKKGVKVRINKEENAVKEFYKLYYALRINKFRSIPQPLSFFENIYKSFIKTDAGFFLEATYKDTLIASFLVLQSKNILYHKSGCSSLEHLNLRPNNLLYEELMEYAFQNAIYSIDLGLSGSGKSYAGLVKFKESMGGIKHDIHFLGNSLEMDNFNKKSPTQDLISSITDVLTQQKADIHLTNKLSEILYPYFA